MLGLAAHERAARLRARIGEHPHRRVETGYAKASPTQKSKPMTGATTDFEYACLKVLPHERRQCVLDAGVVVVQVSPVVRVSDRVVVNPGDAGMFTMHTLSYA